ncbi:MAG: hypothetical protein ACR2OO_07535 [Thermomicrobiales bacterium]
MSIRTRIAVSGGVVIVFTLLVFNVLLLGLVGRAQVDDRDTALAARGRAGVASLQAATADAFAPRRPVAPIDLRTDAGAAETFVEISSRS